MKNKIFTILLSILSIILIILCIVLSIKSCSNEKENKRISLNLISKTLEMETWRDKDSCHKAKIEVLETENVKLFLDLITSNKEIYKLQEIVKENKKELKKEGSVTLFSTQLTFDTTFKSSDTSFCNKEDSIKNKWIKASFGL